MKTTRIFQHNSTKIFASTSISESPRRNGYWLRGIWWYKDSGTKEIEKIFITKLMLDKLLGAVGKDLS